MKNKPSITIQGSLLNKEVMVTIRVRHTLSTGYHIVTWGDNEVGNLEQTSNGLKLFKMEGNRMITILNKGVAI